MVVRRWVAALLALPLLVSCADGEASSDPDPPTPSVTSTESETPTGPVEPELPTVATRMTKAGAIAFTKYYWSVVDYAQETGDTGTLRTLGLEGCEPCGNGVRTLEQVHADGGIVKSQPRTVLSAKATVGVLYSNDIPGAKVEFKVKVPRQTVFYSKGDSRNRVLPGGVNRYEFLVRWLPERRWATMSWTAL